MKSSERWNSERELKKKIVEYQNIRSNCCIDVVESPKIEMVFRWSKSAIELKWLLICCIWIDILFSSVQFTRINGCCFFLLFSFGYWRRLSTNWTASKRINESSILIQLLFRNLTKKKTRCNTHTHNVCVCMCNEARKKTES